MIALYPGQAAGQFLLNLSDAKPSMPFLAASILISLALIPVVLTRIAAPAPGDARAVAHPRPLRGLAARRRSGRWRPGLMLGAFYGLAAVHVRRLGLDLSETAAS